MTQEEKDIIKTAIIKKVEFAKEDIEEYKKFTQPISPDSAIGRISRIDAMMSNSCYRKRFKRSRNPSAKTTVSFGNY